MHNSVLRPPLMACLVGGVSMFVSFSLYIIISSTSEVPFTIFVLFSAVALNMSVIIVWPFKLMGVPFVKSVELLKSLQRMNGLGWVKRFVRSCPPSKLSLGDGGFFDKATSLVILRKSIDLLITFLLM